MPGCNLQVTEEAWNVAFVAGEPCWVQEVVAGWTPVWSTVVRIAVDFLINVSGVRIDVRATV